MPHRHSVPRLARHAAAVCAVALLSACAQTPGSAPAAAPAGDKNLATAKQNPPGIVIFRGWGVKKDEPAQPAATAPATPQAAGTSAVAATVPPAAPAARPAAGTSPETGGLARLLRALPPPTGKPVQDLKKLDDPKQGIELPTAASRAAEKKDR